MLRHGAFRLHPRSSVLEFTGGEARLASIDAPEFTSTVAVDSIVAISGNQPVNELVDVARVTGRDLRVAGDAVDGPRYLRQAVLDGHLAARSLEPGWTRPVLT
jgi:hypothetical protein